MSSVYKLAVVKLAVSLSLSPAEASVSSGECQPGIKHYFNSTLIASNWGAAAH